MAYFHGKKEPAPEVETSIWTCTDDECSGWMRESFTFDETPTCPLCHSTMAKEIKVLPKID
ncbi:cold-shock protein [Aquibacillus sp. 3ASR75-11]|uniref:Cold-shock protein n=1 Tax=Terrihalobacillus insolitus TaxID=2950438 RepID=A0A9X3WNY4_9BACI|nr:cold-shock protein [Terrihalobacillus insolitus]MDC3412152.1 cold-shock protein [Terrihalobacillus insolitus]MDC3423155.1 cold-shock protein [Terrihalobacillus insolitus]